MSTDSRPSFLKRRPLATLAFATASLAIVAYATYAIATSDSAGEREARLKGPKPSASQATSPAALPPRLSAPRGYIISISINNIIMWNPSPSPEDPNYAFYPESLKFLSALLSSPLRPTVHLICTVISDQQKTQILELLSSNGLFSKGLDQRRVLFCATIQGRIHVVKQLGVLVHVDDDDSVLCDLVPHVKRLIRVKRSVRLSIEADKRRMSATSLRSRSNSSPPPENASAVPSPNPSASPMLMKGGKFSREGSNIVVEDDSDELDEGVGGSRDSLDSQKDIKQNEKIQPIPIPVQSPTFWLLDKFKGIAGEKRPIVVVNGDSVESDSQTGKQGPFQRTQSQASFKLSSSPGSTLSRVEGRGTYRDCDLIPDSLTKALNVEFVEGIEFSTLLKN
ncbi:hypothetical protein BDR26DRAFT_870006 [Obelidium mucronatum]|nr:hypothetical protein BDR26DRAFT_870006 [Obelidium mucronatum]